jgi:hypothetical protein
MTKDSQQQSDFAALSDADAFYKVGTLIDASFDARSASGTDQAFLLLDELRNRNLSADHAALVHYFRANAWANREHMQTNPDSWSWEQPECQAQILELRRALRHEGFSQLPVVRKCQIFTNLANQLNKIGRFIEAVETFDRALDLDAKFGMARGNRGIALSHYARALYDGGHAGFMLVAAHDALTSAVQDDAFYEGLGYSPAQDFFRKEAANIESHVKIKTIRRSLAGKKYALGDGEQERRYRSWCLSQPLFINPLNDLGALSIAAQDVLTLPSLTVGTASRGAMPEVIGFFNQIKQEFVSARYLYYEGLHAKGIHFSDRDVRLYNTLDYPAYSFAAEKMRASFRMAYSLFDKISFFLNHHLQLGHKPKTVSFRSVWYEPKGSPPLPLLSKFVSYRNWPLRGLFWLSKDLFEEDFKAVTEPDAESLNEMRNHLEHKYLQLHQEMVAPGSSSLGYSIYKGDFAARTLRLLKLARAAVIYLSLAVWSEERKRDSNSSRTTTMTMPLDVWEDEWKR